MKPQELFNKVVTHLRQQGKKAAIVLKDEYGNIEEVQCRYLTPSGLKCAAGCLILPEEYSPDMEGKSIQALFELCPSLAERVGKESYHLLLSLQKIHDGQEAYDWERAFQKLATEFGLSLS